MMLIPFLPDNSPLFPPSATKGIIYIIRNPLDVAVSNSNHNSCVVQQSIERMGDRNHGLCTKNKRLLNQLRQKMGTWSNHVLSWTENPEHKVLVIRYEDMKQSTIDTFTAAINFSGLDFDRKSIEAAIKKSSFEELKRQENEKGFKEKAPDSPSFFRISEAGSWREQLTPEQVKQIIHDHGRVMQAHRYLTPEGEIVY